MTHRPNEATRRLVVALASVGTQQDRIARIVGVAPGTLRHAYRAELDDGLARAVAGAAENMFKIARKPTMAGFNAARHVLNCFGGQGWQATAHTSFDIGTGEGLSGLLTLCGVDQAAATRQRILDKIAAIRADGEPEPEAEPCPAYKSPAGEEDEDHGTKYSP